jgi:hypothetical protein
VLTKFYDVSNNSVPLYGLAFAVGNLAGPLLLGHLFDTLGRKKMIAGTYLLSGTLLACRHGCSMPGFCKRLRRCSGPRLSRSSLWPRSSGAVGPAFYDFLIGSGTSRTSLTIGYIVGVSIMIIGGLVEAALGINVEGKPLEEVATPLTKVDE